MPVNLYNPEPFTANNAAVVFVDNQVGLMTGILRLIQSGVVTADAASLMIEILGDNASPRALEVYTALGRVLARAVRWRLRRQALR